MIPNETLLKATQAYNANVGFDFASTLALEAALEAVAPLIREDVLKDLDRRLESEARHECADGIWAAQGVIAEMLKED